MAPTVEEDFGGFVAARWPGLEAVALVATLDPEAAGRVTAAALAALRTRWAATLEAGAPTATARRALLERLDPGRRRPRSPEHDDLPADDRAAALRSLVADTDSSVPAALLDALVDAGPLARAALAAEVVWELPADEVASLTADPAVTAAAVAQARPRVLAAHREARAADGLAPADHRVADDLADLVERLGAAQPAPPDPAGLVSERARRIRRRTVLTGGGVALGVGAAGWAALSRNGSGASAADPPSPAVPTTAGPTDPAWSTTVRWPPRGALAGDVGIRALAAAAAVRLLYADDVEDLRVVVAASFADQRPASTSVRAWVGAAGSPAERLTEVTFAFDAILGVEDVVALAVPRGAGAVLVLLTRPTVGTADVSLTVHPTAAGSLERTFRQLRLSDGVGALLLDARCGVAARLRCADYDGTVLAPAAWQVSLGGEDPVESLAAYVASATGVPRERLVARAVVDSITNGSVIDPTALSATGGDGQVVLSSTTTPDGGVVRSLWVTDDGRARTSSALLSPVAVPADAEDAPAVMELAGTPPRTGRFLVVVPGGGATCQLLATSPNAYPVSKVVPMKGRTAVVPVINAADAAAFRLVVKDARGRTTYDAVPPTGRDLLGLGEDGTGWLGLPLR